MIPTLTTPRLTLRPPVMADFPAYQAFVTSDRARAMGGAQDAVTAWAWFCNDTAQWALLGLGGLTVCDRASARQIGQVAVCQGPDRAEAELGWFLLDPSDEGQGLATEAATALRDWALGPRGLPTLVSTIQRDNARSIRLAERLGARLDASAAPADRRDNQIWRHATAGGQA